jgi:hypothetical protein
MKNSEIQRKFHYIILRCRSYTGYMFEIKHLMHAKAKITVSSLAENNGIMIPMIPIDIHRVTCRN